MAQSTPLGRILAQSMPAVWELLGHKACRFSSDFGHHQTRNRFALRPGRVRLSTWARSPASNSFDLGLAPTLCKLCGLGQLRGTSLARGSLDARGSACGLLVGSSSCVSSLAIIEGNAQQISIIPMNQASSPPLAKPSTADPAWSQTSPPR